MVGVVIGWVHENRMGREERGGVLLPLSLGALFPLINDLIVDVGTMYMSTLWSGRLM